MTKIERACDALYDALMSTEILKITYEEWRAMNHIKDLISWHEAAREEEQK
nr:MAG TPA: hypothetical protein [Caudoviricetes sp.]